VRAGVPVASRECAAVRARDPDGDGLTKPRGYEVTPDENCSRTAPRGPRSRPLPGRCAVKPPDIPTAPRDPEKDRGERRTVSKAWEYLMDPRSAEEVQEGAMLGVMFAALALPYKHAEGDPPVCGVLHALRSTVEGWAHSRGDSLHFASVSFADLFLMVRRLDVVIALVRRDAQEEGGA
jgi:hypothetical protein